DAFQKSTLSRPIDSAYYHQLVGESLKVPAHVWKEAMQQILYADLTKQLSFINKPTLIFWGDKDSICPLSSQETLQKGIRGSSLKIYKGVGHALHWEEPERFAKDLSTFIANQ
ncbi:MAG TPA: alpha/beta hydrolase, partial [Flavisolibacter sp.]|nr:alpha/beta hydrolase [Flavisolibacter sp.]